MLSFINPDGNVSQNKTPAQIDEESQDDEVRPNLKFSQLEVF